jgi:hypothetical protein
MTKFYFTFRGGKREKNKGGGIFNLTLTVNFFTMENNDNCSTQPSLIFLNNKFDHFKML